MVKAYNVIKFSFVGKQLGFSIIKGTFLMPVLPISLEEKKQTFITNHLLNVNIIVNLNVCFP